MSYDAKKAAYQEVTILGRPALFAECRIDNSTVPKGLYRYELRHGDENWGDPVSLSRNIIVNYYGAVLTREPFQLPIEGWIPLEDDSLSFQDGGCRTLAEFQRKYPVSKKDVIDFFVANDDSLHDFYFSHSEAQDKATGCVGHLRGDFGSGKQFFTTWWPHQGDQLNTPAFKADIDRAVNWLREQPDSPLHDFDTMKRFCGRFERSCAIKGAMLPSYAFMAKTKQYVYMIRCTPVKGDYQFYIYCYQRKAFEKARGKQQKNDRPPAKKRAEPERYDSISVDGQAADWVEVLAVFAVKVAGSDDVDAADVATMDADRIARLKAVFWDMTIIAHRVEVIHHPGSGESDDGWTERNLHITIAAKTAEEMKTVYHFSRNQVAALAELLEQRDLLLELIEDVYSVSGDTASLIRGLPEDLSPEREAVVRTACSLVGKVNYFWGGKSLVIGWDARWGELRQVTAAGSSTTGTYRPYGLDCSGFVDWVFYNATNGSYIIGRGGGATMQHSYCTDISWEDARPGDLVFYPDNSHVGIVGGRDANGELLIIHCASGYNNVVITGKEGFTSVGRPQYYSD